MSISMDTMGEREDHEVELYVVLRDEEEVGQVMRKSCVKKTLLR